ncbi:thioesterase family protein [Kribbella jejuensis]|uniref:Thioesterase superfamily protein n=1 Tax=Kribbella jejuensis TaxID=236068 RepID=A0A542EN15_9ACTN|nr:acyl-CoA thioesterase domain-containing protein [Kribbella jejuensis]TQJ16719.1 thioesterase superfamily protein [Kribbella jejuensis]
MAYFERVGDMAYRATDEVGGAWDTATQHIAPALGLLAHVVERDRDVRRTDGLIVGRLSYDILGTIPIDVMDVRVRVVRPGRTVELVEAALGHGGRDAVLLRAWLMRPGDTAAIGGTAYPKITPVDDMEPWDPSSIWPGGFIASAEVRRQQVEPGRASFWVRTPVLLIDDEDVSPLARAAGLFDIANGMTVRADPKEVAFPNVDLTAHLFTTPRGDWLGFDTTVTFGPTGIGLTSSVLHDEHGPIGTLAQLLTVRPN